MREIERSAASVEEAVRAALEELGVSREDVEVDVIDDGTSGFGGEGSSEARVRVTVRDESDSPADSGADAAASEPSTSDDVSPADEDAPVSSDEPADSETDGGDSSESEATSTAAEDNDEWLDDQADLVADFLEDLFDAMALPAEVEPVFEDGTMYVDVWTDDEDESLAVLIGRHGAALDALQEIVRGVVHHRTGERCQVVVDVEDYRKRRRAQIVSRARQAAERVAQSGRSERLDAMNAFERKIVHDAVAGISGVQTGSEGEEPDRRVVIRPS